MADSKKVANSVVALSSAAVLTVYGAGYARTRAAADRFAQQAAERRPHVPAPRPDQPQPAALSVAAPIPSPVEPAAPPPEAVEAPAEDIAPVARRPVEDSPRPKVAAPPKAAPKPETTVASATIDATAATGEDAAPVAQVPVPAPPVAAPAPATDAAKPGLKDGTYYGWGSCRHGDIQAAVVIEEGKITEARVERCLTRYSCNWITPIPPRILLKQGTTYDYVSGATESSDAFQDAVAEALSQAK